MTFQIKNHLSVAVEILCETSALRQHSATAPTATTEAAAAAAQVPPTNPFSFTTIAASVSPHSDYDVPLYVAYSCKLYFKPLVNG